jgi:nicotinamidase-related amidase
MIPPGLTARTAAGPLGARNNREDTMFRLRHTLPLAALAAVLVYAAPSPAQTIIDDWQNVKAPPAPELTTVTVDLKTTALLMLDFLKQNCSPNPRCIASLPQVQKLLAAARDKDIPVIYSLFPGPVIGDTLPQVAPKGNEPVVTAFFNKFEGTDLDKILKDKGIKTVILVGTAANGAVLYTGTSAFFHGYQTIIAVDGVSGRSPYIEQYSVYNFVSAPVMGGKVTLTRIDMIKF